MGLKHKANSAEEQVVLLQYQVLELKAQADRAQAASTRIAELEAELKKIVAQSGEIFIQGQDSVKMELMKHFSFENFS